MAKIPALSLCLFIFSFISVATFTLVNGEKTWCVAKPSTDDLALQNNIDYTCSLADCSSFLQPDCPCYSPNNLINHASIAMNIYYQSKGRNQWNCYFNGSALITQTDPSYDSCVYE